MVLIHSTVETLQVAYIHAYIHFTATVPNFNEHFVDKHNHDMTNDITLNNDGTTCIHFLFFLPTAEPDIDIDKTLALSRTRYTEHVVTLRQMVKTIVVLIHSTVERLQVAYIHNAYRAIEFKVAKQANI